MIEFSGEFSEENKKYMLKQNALVGFISALIPTLLIMVPVVIAIFMWDWIFVVALPVLMLILILAAVAPYINKEKTLNVILPKKIKIDENGQINIKLENNIIIKEATSIKKVIDDGNNYKIILHTPKIDGIICEKKLLSKGTIEDFEKLFEGKINYIES